MFDETEQPFDYQAHKDALRCRPTEWLRERYGALTREERRVHVERLAVLDVLDERGCAEQVSAGVSDRTARQERETARRLEVVPEIAAAAHAGVLSTEQLAPVVQLADGSTDAEWARRAQHCAPADLQRIERQQREVTTADAAGRREARDLRWWWREHAGMLSIRGELPDVDGALVRSVLEEMVERMRPTKGEPWDTAAHRGADALVELCRNYADVEATSRSKARIVVHVPADGAPQVEGVSVARATVEAMLGDATVEHALVEDGVPLVYGPGRVAIPARLARAIRLRDGHCRWPGCTRPVDQLHHLVPVSEGGLTEAANLVGVCRGHHPRLEPQGPYRLLGNPNRPDGLRLAHRDDLLARAGPAP